MLKKRFCSSQSAVTLIAIPLLALLICVSVNASVENQAPSLRDGLLDFSDAFAEIAEKVNPSVVNITCTEINDSLHALSDPESEEDIEDNQFGYGSGVIIDPQGYILTSNHVIESAAKIEVKLSDNQKFIARIIGRDKDTDLALIKVESKSPLPVAPLGDSDKLKAGQWVMAIGNPFVYDHTVTVGVISAVNRKLGTTIFDNFIQTDAAINFGNSGGPLLNMKGEVIGINTLISSQGTGIGFSIPINMAKEILPQLKDKGKVSRGFLGLVPQEISAELQKSLELDDAQGVIVSSVQKGTPADSGGLQRYDVIREIDGKRVDSEDQFRRWIAETNPGKRVQLKVLRDKKMLDLEVQLSERAEAEVASAIPEKKNSDKVGLRVLDLSPDLLEQLKLPDDSSGVLVTGVDSGKPADVAGIRKGDLILEVNKNPVENAETFEKLIRNTRPGNVLLLYILRSGQHSLITLAVD